MLNRTIVSPAAFMAEVTTSDIIQAMISDLPESVTTALAQALVHSRQGTEAANEMILQYMRDENRDFL
jgi:hypothetical protein